MSGGEYVLIVLICWVANCHTVVLPKIYPSLEGCSNVAVHEQHSGGGKLVNWRCQKQTEPKP